MPELPKKITIDLKAEKVYIDGVEFPWFIEEHGPDVETTWRAGVTVVRFPVFTEDVEIIPREDD